MDKNTKVSLWLAFSTVGVFNTTLMDQSDVMVGGVVVLRSEACMYATNVSGI